MLQRMIAASFALLLFGCGGHVAPTPLSANHPASPQALEAPSPPPSQTLASNGSATATAPATQSVPGMQHDMHGMTLYTCPMHPKVTSDKPGKCPICGMRLVQKPQKGAMP